MLSCWNCRNGYLRIQRIGSSPRSRSVRMSVASVMEKTGHRRGDRTGPFGQADEEGQREQPDRHITTNYAQQANIVCIHNATLNKKTTQFESPIVTTADLPA